MARFYIILSRLNNIDIKQKRYGIFVYMPPTPNKIWKIKAGKTQQISVKAKAFFVKTEQQHLKR